MDKVFINDLKVQAVIGVYEWERAHAQALSFDIEMMCDLSRAGRSDDLSDAINYAEVSESVTELAKTSKPLLVEKLVSEVANMILERYPVAQVRVKVTKPEAVPNAAGVGVEILRSCK
jgi:dihydroneopterin aldolase